MEIDNYSDVFLKTFLSSSDFRQLLISNWKTDYFDTKEDKILYIILCGFWIKAKKLPTKKDVLLEVTTKSKYEKVRTKLVEKIETVFGLDLSEYSESFVRDQFLDLSRKKKLQVVVKRIIDEVNKTGKVDEPTIKGEILKSLEISDDMENFGIDYYDGDILARMKILQELHTSHFQTLFNEDLDDILKLKRKTVVAVAAELGVGKSLFLNNLAVNISQKGHNVLYLSLEMDEYDISKRLDKIALGFQGDLYFQDVDQVDRRMTDYHKEFPKRGKLYIRSYAPRSLSSFQIRNLLERYRLKNIGIDAVLVDYLTLMRSNKTRKDDSMYMRGKDISEELQALSKENRCLVFTALQVKSGSYGRTYHNPAEVAESLAIPQNLDTLISMSEMVMTDTEEKYFVLSFEKIRDSKRTNKKIFLKLQDNLRIVNTTEDERKKLEESLVKSPIIIRTPKQKEILNIADELDIL